MKTTVELPDELLRDVRDLARQEGTTMKEILVEALRGELERRRDPRPRVDFVFRTVAGEGLASEVDPADLTRLAYGLPS